MYTWLSTQKVTSWRGKEKLVYHIAWLSWDTSMQGQEQPGKVCLLSAPIHRVNYSEQVQWHEIDQWFPGQGLGKHQWHRNREEMEGDGNVLYFDHPDNWQFRREDWICTNDIPLNLTFKTKKTRKTYKYKLHLYCAQNLHGGLERQDSGLKTLPCMWLTLYHTFLPCLWLTLLVPSTTYGPWT